MLCIARRKQVQRHVFGQYDPLVATLSAIRQSRRHVQRATMAGRRILKGNIHISFLRFRDFLNKSKKKIALYR